MCIVRVAACVLWMGHNEVWLWAEGSVHMLQCTCVMYMCLLYGWPVVWRWWCFSNKQKQKGTYTCTCTCLNVIRLLLDLFVCVCVCVCYKWSSNQSFYRHIVLAMGLDGWLQGSLIVKGVMDVCNCRATKDNTCGQIASYWRGMGDCWAGWGSWVNRIVTCTCTLYMYYSWVHSTMRTSALSCDTVGRVIIAWFNNCNLDFSSYIANLTNAFGEHEWATPLNRRCGLIGCGWAIIDCRDGLAACLSWRGSSYFNTSEYGLPCWERKLQTELTRRSQQ